jgi:hypothetical protein
MTLDLSPEYQEVLLPERQRLPGAPTERYLACMRHRFGALPVRTWALVAVCLLALVLAGRADLRPLLHAANPAVADNGRRSAASRGCWCRRPASRAGGRCCRSGSRTGATAELTYQRDLAIADLGVLAGGTGMLSGCRLCTFSYGTLRGGYGWGALRPHRGARDLPRRARAGGDPAPEPGTARHRRAVR